MDVAEQSRAEGLALQVACLSQRELEEFWGSLNKAKQEREMTQTKGQPLPDNQNTRAANLLDSRYPGLEGYSGQEIDLRNVEDAMTFQKWHSAQEESGGRVKEVLLLAAKTILREVPRSARRTLAIQHLISARMDVNMAITFGGRF